MMVQGLRARQRQATHEAIQQAALELALQRRAERVTAQEISEAAGVSQRTFFNHFRSKEEALLPPLPPFSDQEAAEFAGGAEPDLLTALEHLLRRRLPGGGGPAPDAQGLALRLRLVQDNPELLPRLLAVFEEFDGRVRDLIARRTGRDPADLFCRVAAATAIGAARAVIGSWREAPGAAPPPDEDRLRAAFATLRQLLSPDSAS
jgi:AcrR family transcriptional regulator